jgi:hypothetical protein
MRRTLLTILAALVAVVALGSVVVATSGDASSVTRARLEKSLPVTFANLYVDQARLLGRNDLTPESLHATAMCDKHGPDVADVGPGGDWVCLMSWTDPDLPMPTEGYGKFELNVHSNDCYTAAGPTKLTGFLTLTDTRGREVTNPVFEFDGCFDPNGDNTPTGTLFPSLLSVTSTTLTPDSQGHIGLQVTCGTGSEGCSGTVTVTAGDVSLGTMPIDLKEESTAKLAVPEPVPDGATEVTFTVQMATGVGPTSPVTLPVQGP